MVNYRATGNLGCEPKLTLTCLSACQLRKEEVCRLNILSKGCAVEFLSPERTHCHLVVITGCACLCITVGVAVNDR